MNQTRISRWTALPRESGAITLGRGKMPLAVKLGSLPVLLLMFFWICTVYSCARINRVDYRLVDMDSASILSEILATFAKEAEHTIFVSDVTDFKCDILRTCEETEELIVRDLNVKGYDIAPLVHRLFTINQSPHLLAIPSSPDRGYILFRERYYGGAREEAKSKVAQSEWIVVSVPVLDTTRKIALMYKETWQYRSRKGEVLAYSYEDDHWERI